MSNAESVIEHVREDNRTPLSRLGSSKSLYATTGGEIETAPVLQATADAEYAAWQTFDGWAEEASEEAVREAFDRIAEQERGHYQTVGERLDDYEPDRVPALHEYLRDLESTVERVGGLVGRILASERSKDQVVGYFVGNADPTTASLFREFGEDLDEQLELTEELLGTVCDDAQDRERAVEAATGAIEAAYGEYVANLEELGANPKPVC
ncbi:rubrerythrin family protein [Halobacteria archaeon AArc-dxtr1]|nr:rubrerythrin family protein [Halobacteria archaeon AArc-dxtr1]